MSKKVIEDLEKDLSYYRSKNAILKNNLISFKYDIETMDNINKESLLELFKKRFGF